MNTNERNRQLQKEYDEFTATTEAEVPQHLSEKVLKQILSDMRPRSTSSILLKTAFMLLLLCIATLTLWLQYDS